MEAMLCLRSSVFGVKTKLSSSISSQKKPTKAAHFHSTTIGYPLHPFANGSMCAKRSRMLRLLACNNATPPQKPNMNKSSSGPAILIGATAVALACTVTCMWSGRRMLLYAITTSSRPPYMIHRCGSVLNMCCPPKEESKQRVGTPGFIDGKEAVQRLLAVKEAYEQDFQQLHLKECALHLAKIGMPQIAVRMIDDFKKGCSIEGPSETAAFVDKLKAEMLIYEGEYQRALDCIAWIKEERLSPDVQLALYKAIAHAMLLDRLKGKEQLAHDSWRVFHELYEFATPPHVNEKGKMVQTETPPDQKALSNYDDFKEIMKTLEAARPRMDAK